MIIKAYTIMTMKLKLNEDKLARIIDNIVINMEFQNLSIKLSFLSVNNSN